MVEPDGVAGRAAHRFGEPLLEELEERGRDVCARVVHADRARITGEEAGVALLVALLGLEAGGSRTVGEGVEVLGDALLADREARHELGQPRRRDCGRRARRRAG